MLLPGFWQDYSSRKYLIGTSGRYSLSAFIMLQFEVNCKLERQIKKMYTKEGFHIIPRPEGRKC